METKRNFNARHGMRDGLLVVIESGALKSFAGSVWQKSATLNQGGGGMAKPARIPQAVAGRPSTG